MGKFNMENKSCIGHAQNRFTTNDYNKFKIIKVEQDVNEHSDNII